MTTIIKYNKVKTFMKKFLLGLAVIAGSFTFAQQKNSTPVSKSPVRFGIKAGLNVSTMSKESDLDNYSRKARTGFNAGVFANIPLSSDFSVQPEILYSQYGNKIKFTDDGDKIYAKRNLDYITVPVMFQYNVVPNFYLEAGPEFGFKVGSTIKYVNETLNFSVTSTVDDAKGFNLGLGIGAGYYVTPNIGITARYVAGLTDVIKDNKGGDAIKNNVFQVGLAYKF